MLCPGVEEDIGIRTTRDAGIEWKGKVDKSVALNKMVAGVGASCVSRVVGEESGDTIRGQFKVKNCTVCVCCPLDTKVWTKDKFTKGTGRVRDLELIRHSAVVHNL